MQNNTWTVYEYLNLKILLINNEYLQLISRYLVNFIEIYLIIIILWKCCDYVMVSPIYCLITGCEYRMKNTLCMSLSHWSLSICLLSVYWPLMNIQCRSIIVYLMFFCRSLMNEGGIEQIKCIVQCAFMFCRSLLNEGGVDRLMFIVHAPPNEYSDKAVKFASQVKQFFQFMNLFLISQWYLSWNKFHEKLPTQLGVDKIKIVLLAVECVELSSLYF